MSDLWNSLQQLDIWGLQAELNRARRSRSQREHTLEQKVQALEEQNEELRLRLTVLVNLLVAKNLFTTNEITAVWSALEADAKSRRCPQCGFTYDWNGARCGHCNYQV